MFKETSESPRMFHSSFVDYFSRTHPSAVPAVFLPLTGFLLWKSPLRLGATAVLFGAGLGVWSLTEYWLHRTFFHWVPQFSWGERMHFLVHGVHHTWPSDKYRLVMPPAVSISVAAAVGTVFWALSGARYAWGVHAGFVFGYMTYDLTHYYLHHSRPRWAFLRWLKRHHMLHHFQDDRVRFGVSSPLWDYVFGTQGKKRSG